MTQKISLIITILFLGISSAFSQGNVQEYGSFGSGSNYTSENQGNDEDPDDEQHLHQGRNIPSIIRSWELEGFGAKIETAELDTALNYFHVYNPMYKRSIGNISTGNLGGAYLSNDFFNRDANSDFYFYQAYDVYAKQPSDIKYFNTTTPYTLLDYSQSENKNTRTETRFNVLHSQNVNPDLNFTFFYNQAKSAGHYRRQENKNSSIGLNSSYHSDQFRSHVNLIFNNLENQENGGLQPDQDINQYAETETYLVRLLNAESGIKNKNIFLNNEYRIGKKEEIEDEEGNITEKFIARTGFIHQFEYSGNQRNYNDTDPNLDFYPAVFLDSLVTSDTVKYNRLTNIFQLKFYEAPDRKYTFGKRAFIGHDRIGITMPVNDSTLVKENYNNTFVGGGIARDEGEFWKWGAEGKFYLSGYRSGQTELSAHILKPLRIGSDTMSLQVEGELNTIVPDYFQQKYISNHYSWHNRFDNTNEMIIRSKIHSQKYKLTLGMNYALIGNYIFNNELALPQQGGREMLVLSAFANKDIETKHWLIRAKVIWQQANQDDYLHLPEISAYGSLSYKTVISKVMYARFGADVRYYSAFYADTFDPSSGRYFWQNQEKIGNFPMVDLHANLKLKRTRAFFQWLNAASGLINDSFWAAPTHPFYRRTFRLGIAWSFYD